MDELKSLMVKESRKNVSDENSDVSHEPTIDVEHYFHRNCVVNQENVLQLRLIELMSRDLSSE